MTDKTEQSPEGYDLKLPWTLAPLYGKYYGTEILDSEEDVVLYVSSFGSGRRERGELSERYRSPGEPWPWPEEEISEFCCDDHWESQDDHLKALEIIRRVNRD